MEGGGFIKTLGYESNSLELSKISLSKSMPHKATMFPFMAARICVGDKLDFVKAM